MLGNEVGLNTIFSDVMKELGATTEEAVCDGPVNTAARAGIIRKLGLRAAAEAEISETQLTGAIVGGHQPHGSPRVVGMNACRRH
jgi:hypothetical protein